MYPLTFLLMFTIFAAVRRIVYLQSGVLCAEYAVEVLNNTEEFHTPSTHIEESHTVSTSSEASHAVSTTPFLNATEAISSRSENITIDVTQPVRNVQEELRPFPEVLVLNSADGKKDISVGETLYLSCSSNTSLLWKYQATHREPSRLLNSLNITETSRNNLFNSTIQLHPKTYKETGRYSCVSADTGETVGAVYIFVNQKGKLLVFEGKNRRLPLYVNNVMTLTIPCLVTTSKAVVTLWKGKCNEKGDSPNGVHYDPTKGFVIPRRESYFSENYCCQAELDGSMNQLLQPLIFYAETKQKPVVQINATQDFYILVNSSLTLECAIRVEANTVFREEWTYPVADMKRVDIRRQAHVRTSGGHSKYVAKLTLKNVQKADSGFYKCNVTDHSGKWSYVKVNVEVLDPEQPLLKESNITSAEIGGTLGEKVELLCYVLKGFPKPKIKWFRDGVLVNDVNNTEIAFEEGKQKLVIRRFHRNDSGFYECWAENEYGTASRNVTLSVKKDPSSSTTQKSVVQDPSEQEMQDILSIVLIVLGIALWSAVILLLVYRRKFYKQKKRLQELELLNLKAFRKGQTSSTKQDLSIQDQPELLPYDSVSEFPIDKLKLVEHEAGVLQWNMKQNSSVEDEVTGR